MAQNSLLPFSTALQLAQQSGRGLWRSIEKLFRSLINGDLVISSRVVVGTVASTATTMTVNLGFTPDAVEILNVTDAKSMSWISPMTNDTGLLLSTFAQMVASGGITPITTAGSEGFRFGTNITGPSKFITYIATRNRPTT